MANNVYLKGQLACVSANHIVAVLNLLVVKSDR